MTDSENIKNTINTALKLIGAEDLVEFSLNPKYEPIEIEYRFTRDTISDDEKEKIKSTLTDAAKKHGFTLTTKKNKP